MFVRAFIPLLDELCFPFPEIMDGFVIPACSLQVVVTQGFTCRGLAIISSQIALIGLFGPLGLMAIDQQIGIEGVDFGFPAVQQ